MKRNLGLLGAAALLSWLPCAAVAEEPAKASSPPGMAAIGSRMSGVAGDLARKKTGPPVQNEEKRVVGDLDALIASLEKQIQDGKGNRASNNPLKPALDSTIKSGMGGIGELVEPGQSEKDWAKLSARERDRILQSMSEGFPPEYRTVLERYYRRLAEEKTAAPAANANAAQPKDAAAQAKP